MGGQPVYNPVSIILEYPNIVNIWYCPRGSSWGCYKLHYITFDSLTSTYHVRVFTCYGVLVKGSNISCHARLIMCMARNTTFLVA